MNANGICYLLLVHYIGDYLCQSRWMAKNKSHDNSALSLHVLVYTFVLWVGVTPFALRDAQGAIIFLLLNGVAHLVTDYITSRAVARLWSEKREYETFAIMGADQVLHQFVLVASSSLLVG